MILLLLLQQTQLPDTRLFWGLSGISVGAVFGAGVFYQRVRQLEKKVDDLSDVIKEGKAEEVEAREAFETKVQTTLDEQEKKSDNKFATLDDKLSKLNGIDVLAVQVASLTGEMARLRDSWERYFLKHSGAD